MDAEPNLVIMIKKAKVFLKGIYLYIREQVRWSVPNNRDNYNERERE